MTTMASMPVAESERGARPWYARMPRRRARVSWRTRAIQLLVVVVWIGAWQLASGRLIKSFWISSPRAVWATLHKLAADGSLWVDVRVTLKEMILGLLLGILIGAILGVALGMNKLLSDVFQPFVQSIYAIPKIALAPLFTLWLGIGLSPKVALTVVIVFFLVFWTTFDGVRNIDTDLLNVVSVMGARRLKMIRYVIFPSALSSMFTGIKLAIPQALVGAVMGEIIASNRGVGWYIQYASSRFDTAGVFAGLIVLMILAAILSAIASMLERYVLRWKVGTSSAYIRTR
jgi:NitT/TauT family transport system permease protein